MEDTADDEALLVRALRKTGIECAILIARDGEQAWRHLVNAGTEPGPNDGPIRAVLCDLKLPRVDGLELLRRIRAHPRTRMTPVVLFSSSAHDDEVASAYLHGANGYVRKPVDARSFTSAVTQLGAYWLSLNEAPPAGPKYTAHDSSPPQQVELFRIAVEAAPGGMILIDREGRIVLANSHTELLFGYSRDELMGMHLEMLIPERFRVSHARFREEFFADPRARTMGRGRDLFGRRKDGSEMPIEIGLTPVRTAGGDFVLSSVVDLSSRGSCSA